MALGEFDIIERFFTRRAQRRDVLLGVGDDAALLEVPPGRALVAATDTLVEGRHFLVGAPGRSVGHQALAVNLSDLAAMGAEPAFALLSLCLPEVREDWLGDFAQGFHALAEVHGVALVGGDTVRGPLVVTVEVLGFVEPEQALRRSGARPGDQLYISGSPGEAAAGLEALRRGGSVEGDDPLIRRYLYATPRLELGRALRGRASAAIDVSDGLLGDLGKVCAPLTVKVSEHKRLEAYQNVYHLVSVVTGQLNPGCSAVDILRATFPGGSITGCPKIRAMEIIDELEPNVRHVYCGAIGYLGLHQNLDLNVAIRTAIISRGRGYFAVGGGVVYDSREEDEYDETLHKASTLFRLIAGDL